MHVGQINNALCTFSRLDPIVRVWTRLLFILFIYFIRWNIQQKQHINTVMCELTRLERALTVAHNTMVHRNSKTVAQKGGSIKEYWVLKSIKSIK